MFVNIKLIFFARNKHTPRPQVAFARRTLCHFLTYFCFLLSLFVSPYFIFCLLAQKRWRRWWLSCQSMPKYVGSMAFCGHL